MATPFEALRVDAASTRRSQQWYQQQIKNLKDLQSRTSTAMRQGDENIVPGNLYLFRYDPKHKETLPYYDTMPLVLPFAWAQGGFLGINLHYLPYGLRFKLMGALLELVTDVTDPKSRARVSWAILNNTARFPGVAPCVKHYLGAQIRSKFLNIPNDQWVAASMMPLEQFKGAGKERIFADSRRMA
jgi:hypothetical protein